MKTSIALIGMPGSGKSTLGILLAKKLGLDFIDTDILIQAKERKTLQEILDDTNHLQLRAIEESILLEADLDNKVISTGGSVIYSDKGMQRLKAAATIIYLEVPIEDLESRILDYETRGIAKQPEQSFSALYEERSKLYEQYADQKIDCFDLDVEEVLNALYLRATSGNQ